MSTKKAEIKKDKKVKTATKPKINNKVEPVEVVEPVEPVENIEKAEILDGADNPTKVEEFGGSDVEIKKRRSGRKWPIMAAVIVVIVMVWSLIWLINKLGGPAKGVIKPSVATEASSVTQNVVSKPGHFTGFVFSLDVPIGYDNIQSKPPYSQIAEQYTLLARYGSSETRQIAVTIKKASSGAMKEDSAYALRINDSNTYLMENVTLGDKTDVVFTKSDGSEVTYFIPGGNYYATLSATSTRPQDDFTNDALAVATSFTWTQD